MSAQRPKSSLLLRITVPAAFAVLVLGVCRMVPSNVFVKGFHLLASAVWGS